MTLAEVNQEVEKHFTYWVDNFNRKELNCNNARITGEYICKGCIIRKKGVPDGMSIIENKDRFIPSKRTTPTSENTLRFVDLVNSLWDIGLITRENKVIQTYFNLLREITNPSSHSANSIEKIASIDDLNTCQTSVVPLIKWYYSVIGQSVPVSIENALNGRPDPKFLSTSSEKWLEFSAASHDFDKRFQYILVCPESLSENIQTVEAFAKIPWRLVLDFNPKSDSQPSGLLYQFNKLVGVGKQKTFTLKSIKPDFDKEFPHYWFFANGEGNIVQSERDFSSWRRKYRKYLSDTLYTKFNEGSRLRKRVVIIVDLPSDYAEVIVDEFNRQDEDSLEFIICSSGGRSYDSILSYPNVEIQNISADEIAEGVNKNVLFSKVDIENRNSNILVPFLNEDKSKGYFEMTVDHYDYLKTLGIEVVFKGIESLPNPNNEQNSFYKGATISWRDLYEQKDKSRVNTNNYIKRLKSELESNSLRETELVHEAGAGGTTVARRIAFELSTEFPTVILRKFESRKTIDGLRILIDQYTKGRLPLFIVLETFEVRNYQNLYSELSNDHKKAVILKVRRGNTSTAKDRKLTLKAQLEASEVPMFEREFSLLEPKRREQVANIQYLYKDTPKYISAVTYALTAFGLDYDIKGYISQCLNDITTEQRQLLGFICLIHHFTQKSVPIELFTTLLKVDRSKCYLAEVVKESPILDLLHEEWDGDENLNTWRPRFSILGESAMKIILGGDHSSENWKSNLSRWLLELIRYISYAIPNLDDETKDILLSLFITRTDELHSGSENDFTRAILALPSTDGVSIFEALVNAYPNEESFHAHFARYLYDDKVGIKNYDRAIIEAEISLEIQKNSSLTHTLGMCYRKKAEYTMRNYEKMEMSIDQAEDKVQELTDRAVEIFEDCIDQEAKNIYGYESAMRIILYALDFGFTIKQAKSKEDFLNSSKNVWYLERYDKAQFFLEDALAVLEQSRTLEESERLQKSAAFIYECEKKIFNVSGDHLMAKNKYENLAKNTPAGHQYMRPLYRRMYITHLLYSKISRDRFQNRFDISNAWSKVSQRELIECIEFLKDNFVDDAGNTQNVKWWLQASRYLKAPPSIEECLIEISSWSQNTQQSAISQLEAYYYLYTLNSIKAIENGNFDPSSIQIVRELKDRIKQLPIQKNEKFCFEWYGPGIGIQKMISYKTFTDFKSGFIDNNRHLLAEVSGRIKDILSPQTGTISLECGLDAFFVPSHGAFTERNVGDRVKFYVGFRYDQIQAWSVVAIDKNRDKEQIKQESVEEIDLLEEIIEDTKEDIDSAVVPVEISNESLPGLKIKGKIDLSGIYKPKDREDLSKDGTKSLRPQRGIYYNGNIKYVNAEVGGYVSCNLDRDVAFHKSRLKGCDMTDLSKRSEVVIEVFFENGVASLDNHGNYKAQSVSLKTTN
ncbi:tetratricopeptide repeat protein [Dyadobacter jiangsuensis]